jgi:hypothetical protein
LKIEIEPTKGEFVLGEDWRFDVRWNNTGDQPVAIAYDFSLSNRLVKVIVRGKTRPECVFLHPPSVDWVPLAHRMIEPHVSQTKVLYRDELGIADVGEYELWVEYDATNLGPEWDQVPVARIRVASNRVRFKILKPQGIDAMVFEKHSNSCNQLILSTEDLLKFYPTSVYAGLALVKKGQGGSLQEASVITDEIRDRLWYVPVAATPAKREERRQQSREGYEHFIQLAQTFLKAHTGFAEEPLLRKELAISYFFLDKPQEGWLEVETLAKLQGQWADEARDVIDARKKMNREPKPAGEPKAGATSKEPSASTPTATPAPEKAAPPNPSAPAPAKPSGGGS